MILKPEVKELRTSGSILKVRNSICKLLISRFLRPKVFGDGLLAFRNSEKPGVRKLSYCKFKFREIAALCGSDF